MKDYTQKAKQIIEENIYCTIATASKDGKPWISPVFYGFDENYNIYWISDKGALHSTLVRENPQVAIVIFNSQAPEGEGDGVYIVAKAYELSELEDVKEGVRIRDSRAKVAAFKVKDLREATEDGAWRVYKAVPEQISKLTEGEYVKGQYVDKRVEVTL